MDFIDEIRAFSKNIPKLSEQILTEEGTKNALIMPFIKILGYDVFNPNEVNPEFNADVGVKKGEKVDYAIMKDGKPVILFECKDVKTQLNQVHGSQLYRYFSVTEAKVGILTNGIIYKFFTDIDSKNKMDERPFLEINLLDIKEPLINELKKFTKQGLDLDQLDDTASQLKYTNEIKQLINNEFSKPSEDFVTFFAKQVYPKKMSQSAKDKFSIITKEALNQFITDRINDRLKSAMEPQTPTQATAAVEGTGTEIKVPESAIDTSDEEWDAYYIVKAILTEKIDPSRIYMRDAKTYCAILLDDNNRKPITRFYFGPKQKSIAVFDNEKRMENKITITDLNELFKLSDHFKRIIDIYQKSD